MKKKLLSSLLIGSLCLVLGLPATVYADGQKVVTLGADLSEDQKTAVLKYFGVLGQDIKTLTITNQDERYYLGSYVPMEQIGSHTYSCALVCPTNSGGIQVKTANLSWVTSNMIASTLSTSGVVNCDVLAASPFEVSGTGALTGIIMAYESASGVQLDPKKVDLANQELVTTGTIANNIGQSQATNIVNEIKIEVIQGQVVDPVQVEEIVEEVINENELAVELSDEDRSMLTGLMTQIAEQEYDYDEMQETLQRVEDNVNVLGDQIDGLQEDGEAVSDGEEMETELAEGTSLESDSILLNTDDAALGENVIIDATNEEAIPDETELAEETEDPYAFDIVTSDSYEDEENQAEEVGGDDWTGEEEEWSSDTAEDGAVTDEGQVSEEESLPEEGSLSLGQYCLSPDHSSDGIQAAGISQFKLLFEDYDLVPVSGTLTLMDSYGNVCSTVDLADPEQAAAAAVSESDIPDGWTAGSKIVINSGYILQPSENYVVTLDGVVASASDPAAMANISTSAQISTDSCGVLLDINKVTDVYPGAVLTGLVLMDETSAYAVLGTDDTSLVSFSSTEFTPETTDFSVTCQQSGTANFWIDFYDADGNLLKTTYSELTILN